MAFGHLGRGAWRTARALKAFGVTGVLALMALSLACKSSSKGNGTGGGTTTPTATISGHVTYVRIPLVSDANGVPTGLETNPTKFKVLPLRGTQVRVYQAKDETNPDGTKTRVWLNINTVLTNLTGDYTVAIPQGSDTFIEVLSGFQNAGQLVRLIADPNGINSSIPQADRVIYSVRKGLDGSAPVGNPLPGTSATANATVNFDVGLSDKLWIAPFNPRQVGSAVLETSGSGSRPFAIGDSFYGFGNIYFATGGGSSAILDLHYRPGVSENRGSFIEFDRTKFPLAFDGGNGHFFGSLRGASTNDDAWDEGVIFPMLARYILFLQGQTGLLPPASPLQDLAPDISVIEGLAPAMAANALKSPYLADTSGGTIQIQDVRSLQGVPLSKQTVYCAPNIRALAWELILKANALASPGTSATWASINPAAMVRFFSLISPADLTDTSGIYQQLGRLKEVKTSSDVTDLAAIFTDATLTTLTAPFQIPWPRPTVAPLNSFVIALGDDPNSTSVASLPFTMINAVQVLGAYPNLSQGEVAYARFALSKDTAYNLKVVSSNGALPSGSSLEINVLSARLSYTFTGGATADSVRLVLPGNATTHTPYLVRIRILSPNAVVPDFTATVQMSITN